LPQAAYSIANTSAMPYYVSLSHRDFRLSWRLGGDRDGDMAKLTKRTVDALKPRGKLYAIFDGQVPGFGVRIMPSGVKTFILEYRPHGGGHGVAKKRLTIGRYGAMTCDQARKAALDALARIRLGDDPQAEKSRQRAALTVSSLIDAFIAGHVGKRCKPQTAIAHKIALSRLRTAYGGMKAVALTRGQVAVLHARFKDNPFAANRFLAVISKCFAWGCSLGLLPEEHINPAKGIGRYREHARERYLTSAELARLGDTLREGETIGLPYEVDETKPTAKHAPKADNRRVKLDPFATAAIRLLVLTGARLREILNARWEHVDFERGAIFLPDSKTGRKTLYMSAPALEVLACLPRLEGNPFVIAGAKDGAHRADLKKPWSAVTRASGLNGVRIHDLRHSFASIGAGASLGLPIIGKLLGHSQAATTHRYAHLGADPVRRAAETIGATIAAAMDNRAAHVQPLAKVR
jgi:integrase